MPNENDPRDPVLNFRRVLALARRHLPSAQAVTDVDESGGEARAYAIDDGFIFKTQRPHRVRPRTSLAKETVHLEQLASCTPEVNVPRVLGYGNEDDVEYILMTRMPGVAMRYIEVNGRARSNLLRELGSVLRRMHSLPLEPLVGSGLFPGDSDSAAIGDRLESLLRRGVEAATAACDNWTLDISPEAVAASVREGARIVQEAPVAIHSNPGTEHVFVDPHTLELTGVIDFGDAYISHPALDMRRWVDSGDRTALIGGYAAEYPVNATFEANWRVISVANLMLDFAHQPRRRAEALEGLRSLLAE
ncbi:MAG: aminoglycoside phosphotransferase family protein [Chloroflexi bacterium]|nr:aminoglycoside phosphotransferase family protein [Chloroflexota bacterium]